MGRGPSDYSVESVEFIADDNGNVKAIKVAQVDWSKPVENGPPFSRVEGSEKIIEADLVLLAMGIPGSGTVHSGRLRRRWETDPRSNYKADHGEFKRASMDYLLPATADVASLSSFGPSMKGEVPLGQSMNIW